MKIGRENSFIEFEFKESYERDVACRVRVFCHGFSGNVEGVWFAEEDIKSFHQQIEQLDQTRKGFAELLEMSSPSNSRALEFKIFSLDSLGHLAVSVTLQKFIYLANVSPEKLKMLVSFDIDPSLFSQNIRDFKKLLIL